MTEVTNETQCTVNAETMDELKGEESWAALEAQEGCDTSEDDELEEPTRKRDKTRARQMMELDIPLTTRELKEIKETALDLNVEIESINNQLRKMTRNFMAQRKKLKKQLQSLMESLESKKQTKKVVADLLINFETGNVQCFYDGVCLKTITQADLRAMKEARIDERQPQMF